MKNKLKNTILLLMVISFAACQQEDLRVRYPESVPVINSAVVTENNINYGDSITLNVEVTDNIAPLSTLEIKVVVNDEILASESVRTKGSNASYSQKYSVPFAARMPNNAEVEVHISSINVEGFHKDTILFNTIAKRPEIPTMYMVTKDKTKRIELKITDAANYIYTADDLGLGNEVTFLLPTKVTRFGRVDWTGTVFGKTDNGFGIVSIEGDSITLSDPTLIGFDKITLDLFNFTVKGEGQKLVPATELNTANLTSNLLSSVNHMGVATEDTWKTGQMYLGKDVEMTFTGIADLTTGLTPDFFEKTGANTAKFLGATGVYTIYYLPSADYLYVEQPTAVYPDAMWLCGVGFGRPVTPLVKTSSWNWTTPQEYAFCRKTGDGIFQTTIYVQHGLGEGLPVDDVWKDKFSVKFFHQRGWGGEEDATTYTYPATLTAPTVSDVGNFVGSETLVAAPGVYRFTINVNTKAVTFEKIN